MEIHAQPDAEVELDSSLSCSASDSASELDPEFAKFISCNICLISLTISGKGFVRGTMIAASLLLYALPLRPLYIIFRGAMTIEFECGVPRACSVIA